jgi:hypothetical protein
MKYIILEMDLRGIKKKVPIIFPDFLCHDSIYNALSLVLKSDCKAESQVCSAGDIIIDEAQCSGSSETLAVDSNPNDTYTILKYDYFHGL